ncbi:uncharacterized protein [Nicotiana sylvestris]|uniref:Uncharacterized protein LOC104248596 isoform X2 n=1 Tax=Nicotiana sylvestris TaxID=4096 RepID=A0A1U7YGF2_NICSY|nr:PREDICTED: uncharacterized protein LOC104248596 isoform X2 [Nicotiana sylvestris]
MKDSDWVLYTWNELQKEEARKKMIKNQRSVVDNEVKTLNDQNGSFEKTTLDKQQPKGINEEASALGETKDNVIENAGKGVSSESKSVHESADEPANEDVGTSLQLKLANEDVGTSPQQNDVAQAKKQKME